MKKPAPLLSKTKSFYHIDADEVYDHWHQCHPPYIISFDSARETYATPQCNRLVDITPLYELMGDLDFQDLSSIDNDIDRYNRLLNIGKQYWLYNTLKQDKIFWTPPTGVLTDGNEIHFHPGSLRASSIVKTGFTSNKMVVWTDGREIKGGHQLSYEEWDDIFKSVNSDQVRWDAFVHKHHAGYISDTKMVESQFTFSMGSFGTGFDALLHILRRCTITNKKSSPLTPGDLEILYEVTEDTEKLENDALIVELTK